MRIDLQKYWGYFELYHTGELTCRIVEAMQKYGSVTLVTKEIRSLETTGLLSLLDEICAYHRWPRSQITIEHGNVGQHIDRGYTIKHVMDSEFFLSADLSKVTHRSWNRDKTYGMFIGRATASRMYAAYRHLNFEYRDRGLTSFHHDISHYVHDRYLVEYLCHTNQTWQDLKSIGRWSDIDHMQQPPITMQLHNDLWNKVYEKIAIEIVLETSETGDNFGITEKLLRPIMYRRPFLLITGRNRIKDFLKPGQYPPGENLDGSTWQPFAPMRFFENVIPLDYDNDEGIDRVEHVFDILHELIRTNKIETILEDCEDDINHNYEVVKNHIEHHKKYRSLYRDRFDIGRRRE